MANSELFFFHWPPNKSPKKQISIGFKIVFPVKIVHDNYPCRRPDLRGGQCSHDKAKLFEMAVQHWPLDRLGSEEGIPPLQVPPSPNLPSQYLQRQQCEDVVGILFLQISPTLLKGTIDANTLTC